MEKNMTEERLNYCGDTHSISDVDMLFSCLLSQLQRDSMPTALNEKDLDGIATVISNSIENFLISVGEHEHGDVIIRFTNILDSKENLPPHIIKALKSLLNN